MVHSHRSKVVLSLGAAVLLAAFTPSVQAQVPTESLLNAIPYRNVGPYRTGAWTVGVAVPTAPAYAHRSVIYAGLRGGGVW